MSPLAWRLAVRTLWDRGRQLGYGFVSQTCSSATNFGLAIVAGHTIGPSGLGVIFIGFAAYLVLLGLGRSVLTTPLVAGSSAQAMPGRIAGARGALTLAVVASACASVVFAGLGLALPNEIGRGMLLFAPWLVPALTHDLGRSIVFRDMSGRRTALSDSVRLAAMIALSPLAFLFMSDWVAVSVWGMGATAGAIAAFAQLNWRPTSLAQTVIWWKREAWKFGRWLGIQHVVYSIESFLTVAALAAILGTTDYGGLQAVQSVLAPLTLLAPAVALPGLPLVVRAVSISSRHGLIMAAQFAGVITLATCAYVAVMYSFPGLLGFFFGSDFLAFRSILIPIGVGQIVAAPAFGLTLYLLAEQHGRAILFLSILTVTVYFALAVAFALNWGLSGAAWSGAAANAVGIVTLAIILRRRVAVLGSGT